MTITVTAELQGTIVGLFVEIGSTVHAGDVVALIESMKMHHEIVATVTGTVAELAGVGRVDGARSVRSCGHCRGCSRDDRCSRTPWRRGRWGHRARPSRPAPRSTNVTRSDSTTSGPMPSRVVERRAAHRTGEHRRSGRCRSFVEYGPLVIAAQRRRRTVDDLIARTPADGLVGGIGASTAPSTATPRDDRRCRTTTPSSPARRACRTIARRTACSSWPNSCGYPSCSSPRAAADARATPTASACRGLDCLAFRCVR